MGSASPYRSRPSLPFPLLIALALLALPAYPTARQEPGETAAGRIVYLVRHAEKAGTVGDVPLTDAGRRRAEDLADLLADAGIRTVLTTDFIRTRRTAAPLATEGGLHPLLYDPDRLAAAAERIRGLPCPVLVVGHSDTTPALVDALGGDPGPPIPEQEYDRLYRLEITDRGVRTRVLRFGTRTFPDPVDLRILTYNIHHGEGTDGIIDLERIARVIGEASPDAAVLQEVDAGTERAGGADQAARIGDLLGWEHAFAGAMPYQGGSYGEALLSPHPFVRVGFHPLPHLPHHEPRTVILGEILSASDGPPILLAGTHLDHTRDGADRLAQARETRRFLERGGGGRPMVLAGDLNAVPGSAVLAVFAEGWKDAGARAGATFPSGAPSRRIDYVLAAPAERWVVADAVVLDEPVASDHAPLLVELQYLPPAGG
ncbi:MAG: endonuclease/exonuclease/phosphatase family protein [bacterium]